jgi:hypothetical protein
MKNYSSAAVYPLLKKDLCWPSDIRDRITALLLCCFTGSLPFDRFYSELALVLFLMHTIIHLRKAHVKMLRIRHLWSPVLLYGLTILGTVYSSYTGEAFSEWERQLALLLLPFCILLNPFPFYTFRIPLLLITAVVYCITILFLYGYAFHYLYINHLPFTVIGSTAFLNHNFALPIDMHATYFSMYIALSAAGVLVALQMAEYQKWRWLLRTMVCILTVGLIQLSSRAVFAAFAVILLVVLPFTAVPPGRTLRYGLQALVFVLIAVALIAGQEGLKQR